MGLKKEEYKNRLVDDKIKEYLNIFGAVSIEGPKWCGKTWSSLVQAKSFINLSNEDERNKTLLNYEYALSGKNPKLIDEWNLVPQIWDKVRNECDNTSDKGLYILTCSTKLTDEKSKEKIKHSGAGRIGKIYMRPMSLFESGESSGKASLTKMYNNTQKDQVNEKITVEDLANYIIRGGWPANLNVPIKLQNIIPQSYVEAILDSDMNDDKTRDKVKMNLLLRSLARNESTLVSNTTLLKDITEHESVDNIGSRNTIEDYLSALERLHIIENQSTYKANYRSPERIGKTAKKHFTDPSLACACLSLNTNKLLDDLNTFGFMFESLVERDLDIYIRYLNGKLYHFRDNISGLEIDSILEFEDGNYAAIEIKLGPREIESAKKKLINFSEKMNKKPRFMCIIVGNYDLIVKDKETGIYIVPITALRP